MSLSFQKELSRLARTRSIVSLLPSDSLKIRVAKAMYNYQSSNINGIDIVTPLQDNGLVALVNTKDLIGWKILFFGEYERDTNTMLSRYIKPGSVVIEAGANTGSESLIIAKLLGNGHLYCFEPNPYVFERLLINISINHLVNVSSYDIALGETNTTISFNIYPRSFHNSGMSSKYMETVHSHKIDVVQKTLDSFIREQNIQQVDFIKMDVQGAEMDMIMGSAETITRFKPIIFTEADDIYNDTKALYGKLKEFGYTVYHIKNQDIFAMKDANELQSGNWLALYE